MNKKQAMEKATKIVRDWYHDPGSIEDEIATVILETYANAVQEEREQCAQLADEQAPKNEVHDWTEVAFVRNRVSTQIAQAIRHREVPNE